MTHDKSYVEKDYKVVGSRVKRPDGIDKVTGKARYGADASAPGGLVGRVLRSPHPHAKIQLVLFVLLACRRYAQVNLVTTSQVVVARTQLQQPSALHYWVQLSALDVLMRH